MEIQSPSLLQQSITIGDISVIVTLLISLVYVVRHMTKMESKVDEVYSWFQKNTERRIIRSNHHLIKD